MAAGMSLDARTAVEDQDAFEEILLLGSLSSLNSVAIAPMSCDVDLASAALASSVSVPHRRKRRAGRAGRRARNESVDTVPVVNRKNRRFDAARPSRLYRASQMLTDFQKSVDRSVSLSPTALCLSEARDLPPSPSMKSRSSSFSRRRRCPPATAIDGAGRDAPGRCIPDLVRRLSICRWSGCHRSNRHLRLLLRVVSRLHQIAMRRTSSFTVAIRRRQRCLPAA